MTDNHGIRPPERERSTRRPPQEPGGFRVRNDPNPDFRVAVTVDYDQNAKADEIREALTDVISTALGELAKRRLK